MRTARAVAPLLLVGTLALAGCSLDRAGFGGEDTSSDAAADATSQAADDDGEGAGEEPAPSASVDPLDPEDVIVSYELENAPSGAPGGSTVTVGVHSLEVMDDVMLLELYWTPNLPSGGDDSAYSIFAMNGGSNSPRPVLTDRPNLTQYEVIGREASRGWAVDTAQAEARSGETVLWWGYFAAPQEDTDTLIVQVYPDHPVLEIPVTR